MRRRFINDMTRGPGNAVTIARFDVVMTFPVKFGLSTVLGAALLMAPMATFAQRGGGGGGNQRGGGQSFSGQRGSSQGGSIQRGGQSFSGQRGSSQQSFGRQSFSNQQRFSGGQQRFSGSARGFNN